VEIPGRASRSGSAGGKTTFHPCVVLLLDDEGRRIAEHLLRLLEGIPRAARAWVETLEALDVSQPDAAERLAGDLAASLARVTNVHLRDDVRRAGYHVGDASPLVLLIGHSTAPTLLPSARVAQQATVRGFPQLLRLALLSDSRPTDPALYRTLDERARSQAWDSLLGWLRPGVRESEPPVALCLLYQDYDERSWHWNATEAPPMGQGGHRAADEARSPGSDGPEDVRYAVAEAAFALIASGLVDEPQIREHLHLTMPTVPGGGGQADQRFGTLATARLAFPRAQAERACAAYEGAELLSAWVREAERQERALDERDSRRGVSHAAQFVRELRNAIADAPDPEYRRAGQPSPALSAQGVSRLYGLQQVHVDPAQVLATFSGKAIAREMAASEVELPVALEVLNARAAVRFDRWAAAAEQVWTEDAARRRDVIREQVDAELASGPSGLGRARAYLRELRHSVILVAEWLDDLVRFRMTVVDRRLRAADAEIEDLMATGAARIARLQARATPEPAIPALPWPSDAAPASLAAPAANDQAVARMGSAPSDAHRDATQDGTPLSRELPVRVRSLIGRLRTSIAAVETLLPRGATVVAVQLMLLPVLAYAAFAVAPVLDLHAPVVRIGAGQVPLAGVILWMALCLAVSLPTTLAYRRRLQRAHQLRRLLVSLYVRWWADLSGRTEDHLRRRGLATLAAVIDEQLAAVTELEQRLREAAAQLQAQAAQLDRELEDGPASRRDVYVLSGQRFPSQRLADVYQTLRARRAAEPLDPRHADPVALTDAFHKHLCAGSTTMLVSSSADLAARAAAFGAEVCGPYLTGEVVAVTQALYVGDAEDEADRVALGTLLERATPLFRALPTDHPRRVQALAASSDLALVEGMERTAGLSMVVTPSAEWLIAAQWVSQGRPRWWPQHVLPRGKETKTQQVSFEAPADVVPLTAGETIVQRGVNMGSASASNGRKLV
jgi:hypothetical protein